MVPSVSSNYFFYRNRVLTSFQKMYSQSSATEWLWEIGAVKRRTARLSWTTIDTASALSTRTWTESAQLSAVMQPSSLARNPALLKRTPRWSACITSAGEQHSHCGIDYKNIGWPTRVTAPHPWLIQKMTTKEKNGLRAMRMAT
jgi:hypothetical protein